MTVPGVRREAPLRVTLVAVVVVLAVLGLAVSGAASTAALHGYLLDRVDSQLGQAVRDTGYLRSLLDDDLGPGTRRPQGLGEVYVAFNGQQLSEATDTPAPSLPTAPSATRDPFTVSAVSGDGHWRAIAGDGRVGPVSGTVVVAIPLDDVDSTVQRLRRILVVVGLLVVALMGAAAFLLVRRSLRPLVAVEAAALAVAEGDLTRRAPESDPSTEVGSLSRSFNTMVSRLEESFAAQAASEAEARESEGRMRRFVGDASHELRTPLTSIRGFAELYRSGALPSGPDVDRAMSRIEGEASRMGLLVEDLLLLARLDQQRPLEKAPVDVLELATDAVHDARAVDPSRSVELEVVAGGVPPVVSGDAARLRQVLGNLVGNALTHTSADIVVRLSTLSGAVVVDVVDSGAGIAPADRERVFERFFRTDTSRTRASGGSGLGLSIVAALVGAHGGTVSVLETPGGGATFRVTLPLSTAS